MNAQLGTRPAPSKISFARECFVEVGRQTVFVVANPTGWGTPARFESRELAENFARVRRLEVTTESEAILQRIKWA